MRLTDAVMLGASDFAHRTPGAHEPTGDVLDPFVVAYWEGWTAAVMDGATAKVRAARAAQDEVT